MTADDPLHAEGADAAGRIPDDIRHPPWPLIGAGAVAAAVLLLGLIGTLIDRGLQFGFDRAILLAMRHGTMHGAAIGPVWLRQAMVDVTALGGETVLVILVTVIAGFLAVQRHWLTMGLVLGGTITGSIAVGIAKALIGRARPELTDHLVQVTSASFPSGHAANSAIIYLTIASLVVQIVEERRARLFILAVAVLLVTAIGFSRIYLGVHWPSDVLAGWSFGTLWALAWWALGAWARLRRAGVPVVHLAG
uniref:phosphatase PAP2 family protein n=1 Tax=Sphingomonas bacterium TaxID=1895847 RepID=UPI00261A1ABF|nr:phosphatase PAP2 family protein [Sphingomonas bacterium]